MSDIPNASEISEEDENAVDENLNEPEEENPLPKPKFELHFSEREIISGSIPVQWCLNKELVEWFNNKRVTHLAIIIRPVECTHSRQESRKIVPINDLMTFIDFKYSGKNHVIAFPLKKSKFPKVMNRGASGWENNLFSDSDLYDKVCDNLWFDYSSKNAISYDYKYNLIFAHEIVEMPDGVFAPEPSELEKAWVNFFFREPAWDQCDFRRRRMLAYSVQPFLFAIIVVLRTCLAIFYNLLLLKKVNYKPIYQPIIHESNDMMGSGALDDVRVFGDVNNNTNDSRWWAYKVATWIFANPVTLILFGTLGVAHTINWFYIHAALFTLVTLIIFSIKLKEYLEERAERLEEKRKVARAEGPKPEPTKEKPKKVKPPPNYIDKYTVCTGVGFISMEKLPQSKKTVRLRFLDLKNKVCKPYQG